MVEFRRSLVASFLFRFFIDTASRLQAACPSFSLANAFPPDQYDESAADSRQYRRPTASGIQYFTAAENGAVVGAPERHMAADLQVRVWQRCCPFLLVQLVCARQFGGPKSSTRRPYPS